MQNESHVRMNFADTKEAVAVAAYIEQLMMSEQQWVMNRLAWFLTSQSFLIAASVLVFINKDKLCNTSLLPFLLYFLGIPLLGFISSVFVRISINAGKQVLDYLSKNRVLLTEYINETCRIDIPQIGPTPDTRSKGLESTLKNGALPHDGLPILFIIFWVLLFFSNLYWVFKILVT